MHVCAQAAGFLVLVAGTLVYAQGDRKQEEHAKEEHDGPLQVLHTVHAMLATLIVASLQSDSSSSQA